LRTVVEAKGLVKRYGEKIAVNGIDLEIYAGEIFGLLGPNGAGKSSLLKMMYGSSSISEGELFVLGLNAKKNFREIKARIGVVPQEDFLDTDFTAMENLILFASYHGLDREIAKRRADELFRIVKLEAEQNLLVTQLSGGMKRRLTLARGMINHPDLIFLDEPTSGLDPDIRIWIWDFLLKIKKDLGTLVLTTHYMEEAERLCDRVAIIDNGNILTSGAPKELILNNIGTEVIELNVPLKDLSYYTTRLKENDYRFQIISNTVHVHLNSDQNRQAVVEMIPAERIEIRKPNLNDVYLRLAGHRLQGDS
jgi:lipooligosaccharide transport system ATP-binding protein